MASPPHIPTAAAGSGSLSLIDTGGDKENISEDGDTFLDCPALHKEANFTVKRKKPAGFNLRKSIAWNPAFFTEEGVLDNSELSVLTSSQLMANRTPSSGVSGMMSPLCRSGRYGNTYALKEVAEHSRGKLPAKYHSAANQGRKLFSSPRPSHRGEPKEFAETQNRSSSRSIQKCIPRVPAGSIQKKLPNSTPTPQMSRTPKKSQSSLPTAPRSTSSVVTVPNSNKKLAPVKAEQVHRVPGLPPKSKSKISSISSVHGIEKNVVPAVVAIHEDANGSVIKCKNFPPHPQIAPSSSIGSTVSTFAKPSALRMPSPTVGFFTQENAYASNGDAAKRNAGMCVAGNTSSIIKPPRYKQHEDQKSGFRLTKPRSINCTTASNRPVLPIARESNPSILVGLDKGPLPKVITASSTKSENPNSQGRADVDCLLSRSGAITQPLSSEKTDRVRNSVPIVCASHVEGRGSIKEIEPIRSSSSIKAISFSTIEPVEDFCSLKSTCSPTEPIVGSILSTSCSSSQVCTSNNLCLRKTDSASHAGTDVENSYAGQTALPVSLSEGDSCSSSLDFLPDFDSCNHQNTECSTSMELAEPTICADQVPCCGNSRDETPVLADSNSDLNRSFRDEAKSSASEEPNTDGEIANALAAKETLLLHVGSECNHSYRSTESSPVKPKASMPCLERRHVLSEEPSMEDKMVLDTNKLSSLEGASHIETNKAPDRSRTNTIIKDHLKNLIPFTEEWLAVMEACGQEVLEQKGGAVQNSPPDKSTPEPSPWSPVKRKAQDVGPFDCTKYSKSVRTSSTP